MKIGGIIFLVICFIVGCSEDRGPGYRFDLFKNTPNWNLAQAVEKEDREEIKRVLSEEKVNIDLQEPTYGETLLMLAVGNDKLISTRALLQSGAKQNILDSFGKAPIHEVTHFIRLNRNGYDILKLLIDYGADPNELGVKINGKDTSDFYLPLMGAVGSLAATKLLLEHGANLYYKYGDEFPIWSNLLMLDLKPDQNILAAKYLIVDKHMLIPNPIIYKIPSHEPVDALTLLKAFKVYGDPEKQKAKDSILNYLKQIDFPKKGVYR